MAAKKSAKKAAKKATTKTAKKAPPKKAPAKKAAFGRAGTAGKGEGDEAVQAWIAGVKPQHRDLVTKLDALVGKEIPDVKRAVKWSTPFYGRAGQGWLVTVASFKEYVSVGFFAGTMLKPTPPEGESGTMRRVKIHDASEYDEKQLRSWVQQAAKLQGWGKA